ncbi:DUF2399 domain-containing protein [Streptomyces sp. BE133]|uniref:DUF2399 domain-containing protein n=1 Tax=Streptomyces sp. BE133 TaxID=3002523 RepID=UPI002E78EB02|nr:DUF2399 domain-containing protein [Streptomyces sp. BE133]MEE1807529.1 DUF2399 domain-containing protein [Streptomyces sp. BE133]
MPAGQPVTLPPYVLARATWSRPEQPGSPWVFVTENPSVTTAALGLPAHAPVRLLCTVGTPSAAELHALARLAASGWRIAVRADFDPAGLQHTRAVLDTVPGACPWRMGAQDYMASLHPAPLQPTVLEPEQVAPTPWDPGLATAMRAQGRPAYEEALIEELVEDIRSRCPPDDSWQAS